MSRNIVCPQLSSSRSSKMILSIARSRDGIAQRYAEPMNLLEMRHWQTMTTDAMDARTSLYYDKHDNDDKYDFMDKK